MIDKLLNNGEAARELRIAEPTLNRWRIEGCGPAFVKVGRRVFYRPQDIADFVNRNVRTSTSDAGRMRGAA